MDNNNSKTKNKLSGGMKFFLVVLFLYFIVALFNIQLAKDSIINFLQMFIKIIPILSIVFVIMIGVNLYFSKERTKKYLGEKSGIRGWIYTIIAGIVALGPAYFFYPLLEELKKHGMKNSLQAAFLFNRNIKIPLIPVMIYYFGFKYTIVISFYIIVFSIFDGYLVEALLK